MNRITLEEMFMIIAGVVAQRSTCSRKQVGAVITDGLRILSTGYNGVASGEVHCTETPCPGALYGSGEFLDTCSAIHAEQNAIARLPEFRYATHLYSTTEPCVSCTKLILATPIQHVVFMEHYPLSGIALWESQQRGEWRHFYDE